MCEAISHPMCEAYTLLWERVEVKVARLLHLSGDVTPTKLCQVGVGMTVPFGIFNNKEMISAIDSAAFICVSVLP